LVGGVKALGGEMIVCQKFKEPIKALVIVYNDGITEVKCRRLKKCLELDGCPYGSYIVIKKQRQKTN
jgi:hypothetical protein